MASPLTIDSKPTTLQTVNYTPSTKSFFCFDIPNPSSKIKCLTGRILSHWAEKRASTQDQILLYRIAYAAGRFLGATITSMVVGVVGTLWHTAATVVQAALFVLSGLIYGSSRLFSSQDAPKAKWQITLEKFNHKMGIDALHHFGSAYVDFMRATGLGACVTGLHFVSCPEDYISGKLLEWRKPSQMDSFHAALLSLLFR